MSNDIGQELLRIKAKLEKDKNAKLEAQGELKSLMKQLRDDFNVSSLEEADKLLGSIEKEIEEYSTKIKKAMQQIRNLMEGEEDE